LLISLLSLWCWRRPSVLVGAVVLGAFAYGALWCLSRSVVSGGGWLGTVVMVLAALFNAYLVLGERAFRRSCGRGRGWNVLKTAVQSGVIWLVTLGLIPAAILHSGGGWPPSVPSGLALWGGGTLFLVASVLNVACGWFLASLGGGTPLPLDSTTRLVVSGPYRFVRNPMAMAGLAQGLGVALLLESWEVAAYVVVGGLVWNFFIRPGEERMLARDFGEEFEAYRRQVRCWIPRWPG
jgi:protein-S-isoprenylcysteine O-methyltransferase Ste14